jgi:diguanylate cyclase (GGDEF)-like protein
MSVSPVRDPEAETTHYAVLVEDITQIKNAQRDLERMANFDPLTGLPNRRLFRDRLSHSLEAIQRHGERLALLYLDLDNFKRVNDSLGHDIGDILLREVARRLEHTVRREDSIARLGGDEFVILVRLNDDNFDLGRLAQKLLARVREPIVTAQHEVVITASVGITFAPEDSLDPGTLLRNADLAMYRVKARGRDAYGYFEGRMNVEAARRLSMEGELRQAFHAGTIQPYFQPIIRLQDMRIVGFEALARWPHPEHGFIPPDQFIPVAEDCGLILLLGEHLLERAAEELLALRAALVGDLYVAVNLSARQTYDARLFDTIVAIIERTGLPPEGLRLELTESLLMRDFTVTGTLLQRLREHLGTRIAIDDFGTGYSSLSYLKQLPIDALKVDRSFVRDIPEDTSDMEITSAVIAMARALNKDVVAEGVETQAQLEYLQSQGCGFAQGYLLGRPAPPAQFADGPLNVPVDG